MLGKNTVSCLTGTQSQRAIHGGTDGLPSSTEPLLQAEGQSALGLVVYPDN